MGIDRAIAKMTGRRWLTTRRSCQHIFAVIQPPRCPPVINNLRDHLVEDNRHGLDPIPDDPRFRNAAAAARRTHTHVSAGTPCVIVRCWGTPLREGDRSMKTTFLAAAAATAMLVAAPAIAAPAAKNSATQSDAMSSTTASKPMKKSMRHTSAKRMKSHHHRKHMSRMDQPRYDRSATYRDEWNRPMNTGFAPLDFAGNVAGSAIGTAGAIAGTAVGTAGAIAAAPFGRGPYGYRDAYAYEPQYAYNDVYDAPYTYNGTAIQTSQSYAARNGFVCQPGTMYTNSFGQRQLCQ
jgi:hypothetical protein